MIAPRPIARALGLGDSKAAKTTLRVFGARELAAGAMLLRAPAVSFNVWNRVLGDVMDACALGLASRRSNRTGALAGALGFVGSALLLDFGSRAALTVKPAARCPSPANIQTGALDKGPRPRNSRAGPARC
ncbi:MAG: hypothetical protein ABIN83_02400 [Sphingomicrobium sp.]